MKYLNITGPKDDIDRVVDTYLNKHEIHLENALTELGENPNISPFVEINPYKEILNKANSLCDKLDDSIVCTKRDMSVTEASDLINNAYNKTNQLYQKRQDLKEKDKNLTTLIKQIEPFRILDFDLAKIQNLKFIKFRFGRISPEYYSKFTRYVYNNLDTVFYECERNPDYIWGIYFTPETLVDQVDTVYSFLHFERICLTEEITGTPEQAYQKLVKKRKLLRTKNKELKTQMNHTLKEQASDLLLAYQTLQRVSDNFDIRKMAACTADSNTYQVFYILCGWMSTKDTKEFIKEISNDSKVYCVKQNSPGKKSIKPPTKLHNPKFFQPFELFIRLYGLPAYNEIDPTIFVALTYTLLFGIMFGDVGQGLCLAIGGLLIYKLKHINLAGIVAVAGFWSTIFGFLYGSLFGFEDILPAIWRRPMEDIMSTLINAVIFGVVLILIAMILNIINAIRSHDIGRLLFDSSGIAGFIVYGGVALCVCMYYLGYPLPASIILVLLFGIPLLCIMLKEPLSNLIEQKKHIFPEGGKAMFFIEASVELFDVVLSYATNTISFVRVGAFALSHAGMMGVVLSLAGVANGHGNPIIIIFGNILVAGLEGLIVGIQVLRLEYYEMFSRFYKGTGREFRPFKTIKK